MTKDEEVINRIKEEADMLMICKGYDYKTAMNTAKFRIEQSLNRLSKSK